MANCNSRAALSGNDFVDWGQNNARNRRAGTSVRDNNAFFPSNGGSVTATVSHLIVDDLSGVESHLLQRVDQSSNDWNGTFAAGDKLLWTTEGDRRNEPITVIFAPHVSAAGTEIEASSPDIFDATIIVYSDATGRNETARFVRRNCSGATFLGIRDLPEKIARADFDILHIDPNGFAINSLSIKT